MTGHRGRPRARAGARGPMGDRQRFAVIGGVFVAVATVVGFGTFSLLSGDEADGEQAGSVSSTEDERPGEAEEPEAGPPTEEEVLRASRAFLDAWAAGETRAAAALTDDPEAARAALDGLAESASLAELTLTPGESAPSGGTVPFTVDTVVGFEDAEGRAQQADWAYETELTVVREEGTDRPVVRWDPSVLHPGLEKGQSVETGPVSEFPPVEVLDRDGRVLSVDEHPTLAGIVADVRERYAEEAGGSTGTEIRIVNAEGERVGEPLLRLSDPTAGQVPTTIDPALQAAAEDAVAGADGDDASLVAIQPSTGEILAVANKPAEGFDTALHGSYAPGSTFKVVTSSLLMAEGLVKSAGDQHPCPKEFEYGGWPFHNDNNFEIKDGTFSDAFAASCNTAFISQAPELDDDALGNHARDVFGLGMTWQVGVSTMDGQVPTQSDAQMAASLIGQGGVRMNPLTMASVSATVKNGGFLQPYLVPPDFDGRELAQTAGSLDPGAAAELRGLMNTTALYGTAAEAMAGVPGDIGAKTGSAEVDGQSKPNAWFTAYRDDLAVAAVVPASGHGGEFAGPVVAEVLKAAP
ncbi:penicillin-binding transpeptidase domain-containing protein [Streptomyces sp. 6N223]|uniref:penicillin-binding transpeptidase domain-containing protein n=1 Tax=Streptomyces sp. 6N223 TaxID=3457412 RepID=UPI003FD44194